MPSDVKSQLLKLRRQSKTSVLQCGSIQPFLQETSESLETVAFEVDEWTFPFKSVKSEIKIEQTEEDDVGYNYGEILDATRPKKTEMSSFTVDEVSVESNACDIKIEKLEEDGSEDYPDRQITSKVPEVKKKEMETIKCPGCPRFFWRNKSGFTDLSHHIISGHRKNKIYYMYSVKAKYAHRDRSCTATKRKKLM